MLAENHLSALEGVGESSPVCYETPTANVQVLWLDVLQSHKAVNACGGRVGSPRDGEGDDGGEAGEGHRLRHWSGRLYDFSNYRFT